MNRYLLDTNHAGNLIRGNLLLDQKLRSTTDAEFGFCRPSIGELWFMVFNSRRVEENAAVLAIVVSRFQVWEFDESAAREFGRLQTQLRRQGTPIPAIDVQIAAIARANQLILLSSDSHFHAIPDLNIENWLNA